MARYAALIQVRRQVAQALRHLAQRIDAPSPNDEAHALEPLREQFPGAPDHWLRLMAARAPHLVSAGRATSGDPVVAPIRSDAMPPAPPHPRSDATQPEARLHHRAATPVPRHGEVTPARQPAQRGQAPNAVSLPRKLPRFEALSHPARRNPTPNDPVPIHARVEPAPSAASPRTPPISVTPASTQPAPQCAPPGMAAPPGAFATPEGPPPTLPRITWTQARSDDLPPRTAPRTQAAEAPALPRRTNLSRDTMLMPYPPARQDAPPPPVFLRRVAPIEAGAEDSSDPWPSLPDLAVLWQPAPPDTDRLHRLRHDQAVP